MPVLAVDQSQSEWRSQSQWRSINQSSEHGAQPSWESTHVVTSRGSDKLVVPEEKMADHEQEQLSEEEKVRYRI